MGIIFRKHLIAMFLITFFAGEALAQAPTGHAAVWKQVESYWDLWAKRDLDGYLGYHHVAFSGWDYQDAMHKGKRSTRKWLEFDFKTKEVITHDINAINIKIHDKVAIVHYYFSYLEKDSKGDHQRKKGRKTDVLSKQEDKWVIIASHGGITGN